MRRAILVAVALFYPALVEAQAAGFQDGNGLHEWCQTQEASYHRALCVGYIIGAVDNAMDLDEFCIPTGSKGCKRSKLSTL
jgi:hypothetical protein